MTTNLVYLRFTLAGRERNVYTRLPIEQIEELRKIPQLYVNPCGAEYIQNSEYEASRFPEGAEL